jgi:hypothetical protein
MKKSILALVLGSALAVACSQSNTPQATNAGQQPPAPVPSPADAPKPADTAAAPPQSAQPSAAAPRSGAAQPSGTSPAAANAEAPPPTPPRPPAPPPEPQFHEVTIPAGTPISVTLQTPIASDKSKVEDQVRGTLAKSIVVSGVTAVPRGAEVIGSVLEANESGRVKGKASVAFRFNRMVVRGETHDIATARIAREAEADTKGDVKKGAVGAGVGAVVGGLIGGGKGAAIGGVAGGAGTVMATKGKEVHLNAGTTVTANLQEPLTVLVPTKEP